MSPPESEPSRRSVSRSFAEQGLPVDEVAEQANRKLCEDESKDMFVTAWIGELNLDTGVVTYVNAGHNPPVVRRGDEVAYLRDSPGLVLGAMAGALVWMVAGVASPETAPEGLFLLALFLSVPKAGENAARREAYRQDV